MKKSIYLGVIGLLYSTLLCATDGNIFPGDEGRWTLQKNAVAIAAANALHLKGAYKLDEAPIPKSLDDIRNMARDPALSKTEDDIDALIHAGGTDFLTKVQETIQNFNRMRKEYEDPIQREIYHAFAQNVMQGLKDQEKS